VHSGNKGGGKGEFLSEGGKKRERLDKFGRGRKGGGELAL